MICPRCGADNADRAERCYLCEYPFGAADAASEPPTAAPAGPPQPQYPPPGVPGGLASPGLQAVPPPPMTGVGYQPPPPGAYPAGYQPPPAQVKGSNTKVKAIIGLLVLVLLIIIGVAAFFIIRGKTYTINVPTPPGYQAVEGEMFEDAESAIKGEESDAALDYLFMSADGYSMIFVAHQRFYLSEIPPDDPVEAERYYNEHKDELLDQMNLGFETAGTGGALEVSAYETAQMGTGDTALHFTMEVSMMNVSMVMEAFIVVKGKTMFMVIVQGTGTQNVSKTYDYLLQNITFN